MFRKHSLNFDWKIAFRKIATVIGILSPVKLPNGRFPPPTNPAPWIWVRVWTKVKVRGGTILQRAIFMYRIKCPKAIAEFPFCHAEWINLTISQQQLQLFINCSNFFRRRIVNICTCKGDFWKSYFLQRGALSEYL